MPSYLNLNGERLPIGTSDLNGDTDEEEEIGPPEPPQWSDADWEAYQANHPDYYADSSEPWEQPSSAQRQPHARRELSMPATPSADGNLNGDTLLSLCINNKLLPKSNATMKEFNGKKGAAFDEWLTDVVSVLQAKGIPDLTKSLPLQKLAQRTTEMVVNRVFGWAIRKLGLGGHTNGFITAIKPFV